VASLQRQEIEVRTPESALTDEQVEQLYADALARLRGKADSALAENGTDAVALAPGSQRVN
jgi:hypothetical protein